MKEKIENSENQQTVSLKQKLVPIIFCLFVFGIDQLSKFLVAKYIPLYTIKFSFFGDFLRIVHVRNLGAAFSLGAGLPTTLRSIFLSFMPVVVLVLVLVVYFRNNDFTQYQRFLVCGVVGGGFGNVFDRIFREYGVVDFIDFKFYGLFGFDRFPTFNFADSFIMVCGILLLISFLISMKNEKKNSDE